MPDNLIRFQSKEAFNAALKTAEELYWDYEIERTQEEFLEHAKLDAWLRQN